MMVAYGFSALSQEETQEVDSVALKEGQLIHRRAIKTFKTNIDSTVTYIRQAIPYFKASGDHKAYILELRTYCVVLQYAELYNEYYENARFTIEECRKYLGEENEYYAGALNNLNTYYYDQGDYQKSLEWSKASLQVYEKIQTDKAIVANSLNNIANTISQIGDYKKALVYLEQVLEIREAEAVPDAFKIVRTLNDIAWNYDLQNQLDLAEEYFDKSIRTIEQFPSVANEVNKHHKIRSYQGAAEIAIKQREYRKATDYLKKALLYQAEDKAFRKAYSYELLGRIARLNNEDKKAFDYFVKAKDLQEGEKKKFKRPDLARKYLRIAEVLEDLQERDSALWNYQKALQILAVDFNSDDFGDNPEPTILFSKLDALSILERKGQALWKNYQNTKDSTYLSQSYNAFQTAVNIIDAVRQGVVSVEAKNTLSEQTVPIYEGVIQATMERYKLTNNPQLLHQALALAESNKSLLLLEAFNEQAALGLKGLPDSLLERDKELRLRIAFYQKKLLTSKEDHQRAKDWKGQLFKLKGELEMLTDGFEKNYPRFYAQKYQTTSFDIIAGQHYLADIEQAAVEYFVGERNIYGFVIWAEGLEVFEIKYEEELFDAVETLRRSIDQIPEDQDVLKNYQDFGSTAYELYAKLLEPALEYLPATIRSLKIIPDDRFNYIPFDLLLTQEAPVNEVYFSTNHLEYVLESYDVSYDYSLTWMLKNQSSGQDYDKDFIAYAPSFKSAERRIVTRSCQSDELYQLECSEEEVKAINDLLQGEIRLSDAALTSTFKQEAANYRIIHMATHACADEENPLFNKIFLTDDYLSNADLYNTSLNAELVVLSACNTGSGKLVKGEGVLSLARGFVQSGCASSVVSRWSVDDCATSEIMAYFYESIQAGAEKHEALRQAKLRFLSEADQLRSHPYYWSAFVAYGDMRAMDLSPLNLWIYGLMFGALMILGIIFWNRKKAATV